MKTGRLLKFHRPAGEVHAYIYRDGAAYRASMYVMGAGGSHSAVARLESRNEEAAEKSVREWVDVHFPRSE